ncbi:hypothetical protein AN958_00949 [Leucoagaricus sp. SymC.cos]|nr:hypothetical protein AN958_00949 [Leucoagaricus sp. SymC.cos]
MSDLPSSTAPPAREPPFLHYPDGQRIGIFVEAGGILNRPRLIRNLKKRDAVICTDPKHAQVILVDPETWQFIREWGKDENKVVLNYTWVAKCISAGKPLLVEDDYGGSRTCDDGLPILRPTGSVDEEGPAPKSPLPTPRETPMESSQVPAKRRKSSDARQKKLFIDKSLPRISTTPSPMENGVASSSNSRLPSRAPNLTQLPQPHSQSTPLRSPTMADPMSVFPQQQQAPSTMPFGMPNNLMPGFNMPLNMMSFSPQMLAMFAQQQQQASSTSAMATQPSSMVPQMQENFMTALLDIMKMYGQMPGGMSSTGQWPMLPNMMTQTQIQMPQPGANSGNGNGMLEDLSAVSTKTTESPNPTTLPASYSPTPVLEPSIKRKRDSDVMSNLQYTVVPPRNPHGSQSSKPLSSGESSDKLFVGPKGEPMKFFVQVDQNNRQEVTRAIKKNGGIITSAIPGADYAVLYTLSTTFKSLLNDAVVSQTPAVTHHFVLDAISQGSIPDGLDNYLFDVKQSTVKRRKFTSPTKAEDKRLEKNAKQSERYKEKTPKVSTVAKKSTGSGGGPSVKSPPIKVKKPITGYYPKEVTPPPPTNIERTSIGYSYTQEEKDWAEKYIFILHKRDPNMAYSAVARTLYRKLPHHSIASWGTFLNVAFKTQFEEARKRGGIAHRKEKSLWEHEQEKLRREREEMAQMKEAEKAGGEKEEEGRKQQERAEEKEIEDHVMGDTSRETDNIVEKSADNSISPMQVDGPSQAVQDAPESTGEPSEGGKLAKEEQEDIQTVVQFFLDGGDQGEDEELVWAKLAQQEPRKTKQEWIDFFTQHDQVIVARYNKILESRSSS